MSRSNIDDDAALHVQRFTVYFALILYYALASGIGAHSSRRSLHSQDTHTTHPTSASPRRPPPTRPCSSTNEGSIATRCKRSFSAHAHASTTSPRARSTCAAPAPLPAPQPTGTQPMHHAHSLSVRPSFRQCRRPTIASCTAGGPHASHRGPSHPPPSSSRSGPPPCRSPCGLAARRASHHPPRRT